MSLASRGRGSDDVEACADAAAPPAVAEAAGAAAAAAVCCVLVVPLAVVADWPFWVLLCWVLGTVWEPPSDELEAPLVCG